MITKKEWNALSERTRKRIVSIVYAPMSNEFQEEMVEPWHHHNDTWHDLIFSSCYWYNDKKCIKVCVNIPV